MQTVAPARASPSAIARPMPRDAPVTSATRLVRSTRTGRIPDSHHQRRALAEEAERDHERALERGRGYQTIRGDDRRKRRAVEGRRTSEQLHRARRRPQVRVRRLHAKARRRLDARAEHPRERPGFGLVVGGYPIAMEAQDVGSLAGVVDHTLDHPGETARQARRLGLARQAILTGAPGEADDLATDPRAPRARVLDCLE